MVGFVYLVFGIVSCGTSITLKIILIFTFIYVCAYTWAMHGTCTGQRTACESFSLLFRFQGLRLLGLVASAFTHRATPLALNFIPWWAILVFVICALGDFSQSFDYLWPNHFSLVDFKSYHLLACSITISYITIRLSTYFHFIVHTFGEVLISSILCIYVSVLVYFLLLLIWI